MGVFSRNKKRSSSTRNLLSTPLDGNKPIETGTNTCYTDDDTGWGTLSFGKLDPVESPPTKPMSIKQLAEMEAPNNNSGNANWTTCKSDHSPVDVMDVESISSFPDLRSPMRETAIETDESLKQETTSNSTARPVATGTAGSSKPKPSKSKAKGLSKSMHTPSKSRPATTASRPSPNTTNIERSSSSEDKKYLKSPGQLAKSSGKLLSRVLNGSGHGVRKAARNQEIESLKLQNEKLQKDCKKLKKLLSRKTAALTKLEESMQQYEDPSTLYAQKSSYNIMREQSDLQIEVLEKQLEARDDKIVTMSKQMKDQKGRIAYFEILCLKNGIPFDEQQLEEEKQGTCDDLDRSEDDKEKHVVNDEQAQERPDQESNSKPIDTFNDASSDDDSLCSDDDSFACEDDNEEDEEELWEEDIKDGQDSVAYKGHPSSKLGVALGQLEGPTNEPVSRDLEEKSIGINDLSKQTSRGYQKSSNNLSANSWLNLNLGLSHQDNSKIGLGLPSIPIEEGDEDCNNVNKNNESFIISDKHSKVSGMGLEDFMKSQSELISGDQAQPNIMNDDDTWAQKTVNEDALGSTGTNPILSPVVEGKRSRISSTRRSKSPKKLGSSSAHNPLRSRSSKGRLERSKSARISLNRSNHSKATTTSKDGIERHSTGTVVSKRRNGNKGATPKRPIHKTVKQQKHRDRASVMESLEKSLGASIHFESADLCN